MFKRAAAASVAFLSLVTSPALALNCLSGKRTQTRDSLGRAPAAKRGRLGEPGDDESFVSQLEKILNLGVDSQALDLCDPRDMSVPTLQGTSVRDEYQTCRSIPGRM